MRAVRTCVAAAAAVGLALASAGCGSDAPDRSAEAFCGTLRSEKQRILDQLERNGNVDSGDRLVDAIAGFGASIQALGELRTYFRKLSDVAPEEVRTEVEILAEHYDSQLENLGDAVSDPAGALVAGLVGGVAVSGQLNTVHTFARDNCGEGI